MFRFSGVCMEVPPVESLKWMNIDIIMPVCIVAVIRATVMIGGDFTLRMGYYQLLCLVLCFKSDL